MNINNLEISPEGLMPSKSIKVVCNHVPEAQKHANCTEFHTLNRREGISLKSAGVQFGWKDNLQTFGL